MPQNSSQPSPKTATGGASANKAGKILESVILPSLVERGFRVVGWGDWQKTKPEKRLEKFGAKVVVKQYRYTTIYGETGRLDAYIMSPNLQSPICVECKWQDVAGSVDEKLPYVYLDCVESYPSEHVLVVIDGEGFKKGAIPWLKAAIAEKRYFPEGFSKLIEPLSIPGYLSWAQRNKNL